MNLRETSGKSSKPTINIGDIVRVKGLKQSPDMIVTSRANAPDLRFGATNIQCTYFNDSMTVQSLNIYDSCLYLVPKKR